MENTNVPEVKMPITYDDLKQSLIDSGRPYDFTMIDRAYALAEKAHGAAASRTSAIRFLLRRFWSNWAWTARALPLP